LSSLLVFRLDCFHNRVEVAGAFMMKIIILLHISLETDGNVLKKRQTLKASRQHLAAQSGESRKPVAMEMLR